MNPSVLPQKKFLWMYFVLHCFLSLSASVPRGRDPVSLQKLLWLGEQDSSLPNKGSTGRAATSHLHCRSLQLSILLFVQSLSSAELLGACFKLNKTTNVCRVKAQEAFKGKDCYMLLPEQNNLGRFLLNRRSTAVIVPSSISSNGNWKDLVAQKLQNHNLKDPGFVLQFVVWYFIKVLNSHLFTFFHLEGHQLESGLQRIVNCWSSAT